MFDKEYQTVEVIKSRKTKKTSIVMDTKGQYFIAKKFAIENAQTIQQIEMMKTIDHPNIVKIHEMIVENDSVYIIEEYCEEGDLSFHMLRRNRIKRSYYPEETVAKWTLQILLAIQYLHNHQIIHRDLRTQNIFLTAQGNIKIGAFKFSKMAQKQQGLGLAFALINSTYYAPPECLEKNGSNQKADIWAFGCVIQQICTLKPNNIIENAQKLKGKHQSLPAIYSQNLNQIYLSCLNVNPNDRPKAQQILGNPYYMVHLKKFIQIQQTQQNKKRKIPIKKYQVHKKNQQKLKLDHLKAFTLQKKISINNDEKAKILKRNSREDGPYKIKIQAIKDLQNNDREFMRKSSIQTRKDRQKLPQIKHNRAKSRQVTKRDSLDRMQNFLKSQNQKQIQSETNLYNEEIKFQQQTLVENSQKITKQLITKSSIQTPNRMMPPPIPKPPRKKSLSSQTSSDSKKMSDSCTSSPKKQQQYRDDKMKSEEKEKYYKNNSELLPEKQYGNLLTVKPTEQQQQLSFQLEQQQECKIKSNQNQNQIVDTYKVKLEELIQFMAYKYSPNLQTIFQRTFEADSNTFANIKF